MWRVLVIMSLSCLLGCGEQKVQAGETSMSTSAPLPADDAMADDMMAADAAELEPAISGYLLGVMQRPDKTGASGGRNEWILKLDPKRGQIYFGQLVEGRISETSGPYVAPVTDLGVATLTAGKVHAEFTAENCESDNGGLGSGVIRATVTLEGAATDEPITMCMVSELPDGARVADWSKASF